jgi:hypothetical protein
VAPTATATVCNITFSDVPPGSPFYPYVTCLACRGVISGYPDGTFRPGADVTRAEISKIVSNSAGFNDDPGPQLYQDVPPTDTFYPWINRLSNGGIMEGYPCGGHGPQANAEPCQPPENLPYFRPYDSATRGQITKVVVSTAVQVLGWTLLNPDSNTFEDVQVGSPFFQFVETAYAHQLVAGYPCGTRPAGRCVPPANKPYFLPSNNVTRGQAAKMVSNTFFPSCSDLR